MVWTLASLALFSCKKREGRRGRQTRLPVWVPPWGVGVAGVGWLAGVQRGGGRCGGRSELKGFEAFVFEEVQELERRASG